MQPINLVVDWLNREPIAEYLEHPDVGAVRPEEVGRYVSLGNLRANVARKYHASDEPITEPVEVFVKMLKSIAESAVSEDAVITNAQART